tara:strand:- start:2310 stop:3104 length:795 start_codon:yes stop_codon:yes gene_type:complete
MNAIILAAGEGKRLRPLTNDRAKCLINFHGKTLLDRQISIFKKCGINDISIVTGYNANMFQDNKLEYFFNDNFKNTNMVKSLFCAEEKITQSTIVSYGDIIFESKVLEKLIESKDDFSIVIDKNWEEYWKLRFENPIHDAESLKLDQENFITDIGQKVEDIQDIEGQYIGLMKFQNDASEIIKKLFYKCQREFNEKRINLLNSNTTFDNTYMTDILQGLIHQGEKLKAVNIENGWLEFDNMNDYELYVNNNSKDVIKGFYDENN